MKMNYLRRSYKSRISFTDRALWGAVILALFLLFVLILNRTKLGEKLFSFGHLLWNQTKIQENSSTHDALLLAIKLLSKENSDLSALLGRNISGHPHVVGHVLVPPGSRVPNDTLIIDVGARQGITKGDLVIVAQKTAIGKIAEVYANESKVLLFSSPDTITPISIGDTNIPADAKGRGGGNYEITIPRESLASEGDLIVHASYPSYILGGIGVIQENETDQFKKILFVVPVTLQQISYVDVLLSSPE